MQPSPRAFEIYEPIAEALERIAGTFDSTWDPASVHRTFHIGLVGYASLFLVPALMLTLRAEAPSIQLLVDYMSAGQANRLLGGPNLDFVVGMLPNKNPAHLMEPLSVDRFVVIARRSHPEIAGDLTREKYTRLEHVRIPIYASIVDAKPAQSRRDQKLLDRTRKRFGRPVPGISLQPACDPPRAHRLRIQGVLPTQRLRGAFQYP